MFTKLTGINIHDVKSNCYNVQPRSYTVLNVDYLSINLKEKNKPNRIKTSPPN